MFRKFQQRNFVETVPADNGQATPPASTDNAPADPPATPPSGDEKRFTIAEVEGIVKERLERDREAAKKKKETEDAAAERTRLAEEGKLKELSEKQAADLLTLTADREALTTEVTGLKESLTKYEALFTRQLTEQKAALPEPVQKLLEKMPLLDQMAWITENAAKLGVPMKGVPATPAGSGSGTGSPVDDFISGLNKGQEKK